MLLFMVNRIARFKTKSSEALLRKTAGSFSPTTRKKHTLRRAASDGILQCGTET